MSENPKPSPMLSVYQTGRNQAPGRGQLPSIEPLSHGNIWNRNERWNILAHGAVVAKGFIVSVFPLELKRNKEIPRR
jgi:hypothetical protein